jgi:peptide/nickel transport system substrate-binding protein
MQALAGYLSDIGVTLNIKNVSPDQYVPSILSGDYPAALLPYGMVDAYFDFGQLVVPGGGFNPFGSSDDQINRLYATASAGSDNSARSKDLKEINARVVELAWFLPMFTDAYGYVHNKNVSGVAWDTFRPPMYYDWAPAK